MKIYEARQAVDDAKQTLRASDEAVEAMVELISGRLRSSIPSPGYGTANKLKAIKAELKNFDSRTGSWK